MFVVPPSGGIPTGIILETIRNRATYEVIAVEIPPEGGTTNLFFALPSFWLGQSAGEVEYLCLLLNGQLIELIKDFFLN